LQATIAEYRDFIQVETLCIDLSLAENDAEPCDLNGHALG